jgi:hypothetical protein
VQGRKYQSGQIGRLDLYEGRTPKGTDPANEAATATVLQRAILRRYLTRTDGVHYRYNVVMGPIQTSVSYGNLECICCIELLMGCGLFPR